MVIRIIRNVASCTDFKLLNTLPMCTFLSFKKILLIKKMANYYDLLREHERDKIAEHNRYIASITTPRDMYAIPEGPEEQFYDSRPGGSRPGPLRRMTEKLYRKFSSSKLPRHTDQIPRHTDQIPRPAPRGSRPLKDIRKLRRPKPPRQQATPSPEIFRQESPEYMQEQFDENSPIDILSTPPSEVPEISITPPSPGYTADLQNVLSFRDWEQRMVAGIPTADIRPDTSPDTSPEGFTPEGYRTPFIPKSRFGYTDPRVRVLNLPPGPFKMATPLHQTVVLTSPSRGDPVLVDIEVDPKPLKKTESGEHFVCDISLDVQPGPQDLISRRQQRRRISPTVTYGIPPEVTPTSTRRHGSSTPTSIFRKRHFNIRRVPGKHCISEMPWSPEENYGTPVEPFLPSPPYYCSDRSISWERSPSSDVYSSTPESSPSSFQGPSYQFPDSDERSQSPLIKGPSYRRKSPGSDERSPSPLIKGPSYRYQSPGSDERSPSPLIKGPSYRYQSPGSDERSPSPLIKGPSYRYQSPGSDERSPSPLIRGPSYRHQSPGSDERSPSPLIRGSSYRHQSPGSDERSPSPLIRGPSYRYQSPGSDERSPSPLRQSPGFDSAFESDLSPLMDPSYEYRSSNYVSSPGSSFQRSPSPAIESRFYEQQTPSSFSTSDRSASPMIQEPGHKYQSSESSSPYESNLTRLKREYYRNQAHAQDNSFASSRSSTSPVAFDPQPMPGSPIYGTPPSGYQADLDSSGSPENERMYLYDRSSPAVNQSFSFSNGYTEDPLNRRIRFDEEQDLMSPESRYREDPLNKRVRFDEASPARISDRSFSPQRYQTSDSDAEFSSYGHSADPLNRRMQFDEELASEDPFNRRMQFDEELASEDPFNRRMQFDEALASQDPLSRRLQFDDSLASTSRYGYQDPLQARMRFEDLPQTGEEHFSRGPSPDFSRPNSRGSSFNKTFDSGASEFDNAYLEGSLSDTSLLNESMYHRSP